MSFRPVFTGACSCGWPASGFCSSLSGLRSPNAKRIPAFVATIIVFTLWGLFLYPSTTAPGALLWFTSYASARCWWGLEKQITDESLFLAVDTQVFSAGCSQGFNLRFFLPTVLGDPSGPGDVQAHHLWLHHNCCRHHLCRISQKVRS